MASSNSSIILYQSPDGSTSFEVRLDHDTVWLSQKQVAELFDVNVPAVSKHIRNILSSGELDASSTVSKMEIVQLEGTREVKRSQVLYNLDMIISVGYRVNSNKATRFRIWATQILKDYLVKGTRSTNSDCGNRLKSWPICAAPWKFSSVPYPTRSW